MTGPIRGPMAAMPLDLTKSARSLTMASMTASASLESMAPSPSFSMAFSGAVPEHISFRRAGRASLAKRPAFSMPNASMRASSAMAPGSSPSCSSSPKVFRTVVAAMDAMPSAASISNSSSMPFLTIWEDCCWLTP